MARLGPPGDFEQLVLLAVLRLGDAAYAVPIRREIAARTRRAPARGAVYITLDRLEGKGYLESRLGDPAAERGGRPRRYYRVKPAGVRALEQSWTALRRMWEGLEPKVRET
ncbi:MAG TPA: helix-turn-helix transcriptional regulator [Candidatus Polarisedimenticolia bacterium]|nr:helix-turn-helix transcriptional regulator [Candidatus Polarisedimenticolia bacterium]